MQLWKAKMYEISLCKTTMKKHCHLSDKSYINSFKEEVKIKHE